MADIVVCCDGTWNTPDDLDGGLPAPTNVFRIHNALAAKGVDGKEIKRYYHPGVGTEGGYKNWALGGGLGVGLSQNVRSAYRWLAGAYGKGDRIWLFGFSRGAFTVRSMAGMVSRCGLLDPSSLDEKAAWAAVDATFADYRAKRDDVVATRERPLHGLEIGEPALRKQRIHFIGVWDTVGALGVPDDMALLDVFDDPTQYEFHDTDLSETVGHARHAVALDERRKSFTPTLWADKHKDQDLKQMWFPGVHADVGGGYGSSGLADGALRWMMDEARDAPAAGAGLAFRPNDELAAFIKPDPLGVLHDSVTGVFKSLLTQPREAPSFDRPQTKLRDGAIHQSALDRRKVSPLTQPSYWPSRTLDANSCYAPIEIFARLPWSATHLYLEKDVSYTFEAQGEWLDKKIACGPEGPSDEHQLDASRLVHLTFSGLGKLERTYARLRGKPETNFWYTKREEDMPWFALVGMIASGEWFRLSDGSLAPKPLTREERSLVRLNQSFMIGRRLVFTPKASGYLYCFANDAWRCYANNKGSVRLTVSRSAAASGQNEISTTRLAVEPQAKAGTDEADRS